MSCIFVSFCCSEKEILHEEINSLEVVKDKLKARIAELEDEVCKTRQAFTRKSDDAGTATNAEVRALYMVFAVQTDNF